MNILNDLCYKCKEKRTEDGWTRMVPGEHCHHEPREKPVPKCIRCEGGQVTFTIGYNARYVARFCPECGKSLT